MLNAATVKRALSGHSWMGVATGALMYLICISGTMAVLYPQIERWEEPYAPEATDYDPQAMERALNTYMQEVEITPHMYLNLPTDDVPRAAVSTETESRFVNPDGSLAMPSAHNWTHFLIDLHIYLTLPSTIGIILVSLLGLGLVALILTGFLAHPSIIKDAFSWRRDKGNGRVAEVDLHNRLSVWAAPFHLIIAVTGAWFGLALLMILVVSTADERSPTELSAAIFGEEPILNEQHDSLAVADALSYIETEIPEGDPWFVVIHEAGTPQQFMEVAVTFPDRLIYSESYRFDPAGNYLGSVGFRDGEVGKQAIYSIYRLHFGHFGGFFVRILYVLLGAALTVVSVTGINIWLRKRKQQDQWNGIWTGIVWGTPAGLFLSAVTALILGAGITTVFWLTLLLCLVLGAKVVDLHRFKRQLCMLSASSAVLLMVVYALSYWQHLSTPAAWQGLIAIALTAFLLGRAGRPRDGSSQGDSSNAGGSAGGNRHDEKVQGITIKP